MIWLTWRQHRMPGLVASGAVAAVSAALLYVAIRARQIADSAGVSTTDAIVRAQVQAELGQTVFLALIGVLVLFLPAFIALFAGAALLSREFEERTHRLVWTQGISRERWFISKSLLLGAALTLASAVLSGAALLAQPVLTPLVPTAGRFANFDIEIPVMVGWALLTFALGTLYGAFFKRALPTLFATLVSFVALRIYVVTTLRPKYAAPEQVPWDGHVPDGSWLFGHRFLDSSGHDADPARIGALMQSFGAHVAEYQGNLNRYLEDNGVFQPQVFQPADRFWTFQAMEFGLLFAASVLCALVALWLVRRVQA